MKSERTEKSTVRVTSSEGFTLIETVAALAIVSIGLLGLLQLHLVSIRTADKAQETLQAVFLAQETMAEVLSTGFPQTGTRSGVVEADGGRFTWRTEVTDASVSQSRQMPLRLNHLRKLSVEVASGEGPGRRHVRLTTYVAENRIRES
jgi:type II secretion system protein I